MTWLLKFIIILCWKTSRSRSFSPSASEFINILCKQDILRNKYVGSKAPDIVRRMNNQKHFSDIILQLSLYSAPNI